MTQNIIKTIGFFVPTLMLAFFLTVQAQTLTLTIDQQKIYDNLDLETLTKINKLDKTYIDQVLAMKEAGELQIINKDQNTEYYTFPSTSTSPYIYKTEETQQNRLLKKQTQ